MRLFSVAILGSVATVPGFGFHSSCRVLPFHTPRPTQLFLADQIKDYKKGLSKISGAGSDTVSQLNPPIILLVVSL